MKPLVVLLSFLSLNVVGQQRMAIQFGPGYMSETGFKKMWQPSFDISWQIKNNFTWGINFNTMLEHNISGSTNFEHCDSVVRYFFDECVEGHDSQVFSAFSYQYTKSSLKINIGYVSKLNSDKSLQWLNGVSFGFHWFTRHLDIKDLIFDEQVIEKGKGLSFNYMNRLIWAPLENKAFEVFVQMEVGSFISPQTYCSDAICDNFLRRARNHNSSDHLGIAINPRNAN